MNALEKKSPKQCDICRGGSNEDTELYLGPWMQKGNVTVHYHCLLLSTNLPQEGEDCSGINGFLLRHIRAEIAAAGKRFCEYCGEVGASIQCHKCKVYFDISCGIRNLCLFEFVGEFKSYCHQCITLDKFQKKAKKNWHHEECYICKELLACTYSPTEYLYAPCCKKGFVHRRCMQEYASTSGYYMRCIWCRCLNLRQSIRFQGIFVPDREAKWETKARFMDLHRGHRRCDVEHCKCVKGRDYKSSRWDLINCNFCGSFGVHYPHCIPKPNNQNVPSKEEYKCETCASTEKNIKGDVTDNASDYFDLYVCKSNHPTNVAEVDSSSSQGESQCSSTVTTSGNVVGNQDTINNFNTNTAEISSTESFLTESTKEFTTNAAIDQTQTENDCEIEEVDMFDFTEDLKLVGTCKLRYNKNSPRFAEKSMEVIVAEPELFSESDIVERTGDIMPFQKVKFLLTGEIGIKFLAQASKLSDLCDSS